MTQSRYIILLLLGALALTTQAQPLSEIPYRFKLEAADTAFARMDYYNAVEWYDQCYKESRDPEIARKIAISHDKMRDYKRAERWYGRIVDKDTSIMYPDFWFEYGRLLKKTAKYPEAQRVFTKLLASGKLSQHELLIQNEMIGIDLAQTMKTPTDILIETAGNKVNTRNSEASPAIDVEGDLHFVSFGSDDVIKVTSKSEDFHAKIYKASKDDKGRFRAPKPLDDKINRPGFHNSHVSFSQDGERMYYTRAIVSGGEVTVSDLYYSDKSGRGWGAPQPITSLNGQFISKHPSVGKIFDQDVLFFSSNRPGTVGGLDLFYAPIDRDGSFGQPVHLGDRINTPGDEITPTFAEGFMYFSSNGHPTLGGFDIFRSEWDGSQLLDPENMGKGFNTNVDDLFYLPGDDESGYLVSNREGTRSVKSKTCCDDIFTFAKKEFVIKLRAIVYEGEEGEVPLLGTTFKVFQKVAEDLSFPDVQKNDEGNEFEVALDPDRAYIFVAEKKDYEADTVEFNTVGVRESKNFKGIFRLNAKPKPAGADSDIEVYTIYEPIRLNNIYYDLDDDKILPDAEGDLNFIYDLMIKYADMVIELSSHTDSRGEDPYNENLSQRRANSARQYLIQKGIDSERIVPKGYGETRLINRCKNGVPCSEAEHRLNRRTEFTIIAGPQTIEVKRQEKPADTGGSNRGDGGSNQNDGGSASLGKTTDESLAAAEGAPQIKFDVEEKDLGILQQGMKKKEVFPFTNVGDGDLLIELATACECTELDWPREAIKPGQRGTISIEYDSTDKEGSQDITIDVIANTEPIVTQAFFKVLVEKPN